MIYVVLTTVLFLFPPDLPVTGNNMSKSSAPKKGTHPRKAFTDLNCADYCIVAFGIVLIISSIQWIVDGRKNFTGPRINLDDLANGVPIGEPPMETGKPSGAEEEEKKVAR